MRLGLLLLNDLLLRLRGLLLRRLLLAGAGKRFLTRTATDFLVAFLRLGGDYRLRFGIDLLGLCVRLLRLAVNGLRLRVHLLRLAVHRLLRILLRLLRILLLTRHKPADFPPMRTFAPPRGGRRP